MRVRGLRLAVVALFALSVVGLATVEPDGDQSVLVTAAEATEKAKTAAFTIEVTFTMAGPPSTVTGEGRADLSSGDGVFSLRTPPSEVVVHDGVAYSRTAGQPTWLAVDAKAFGRSLPAGAAGGMQTDPAGTLEALRQAGAGDVRREGSEPVRGVPTTRWVADIDPAQLLRGRDAAMVEALRIRSLRYTVWVDAEQRLRRLRSVLDAEAMSVDMTMELFDFGVAVTVEPPPADQVQRLPTR